MPIIILEGPDGSGKTTLAKRLADELHLTYHHEGPPPSDVPPVIHYGRTLWKFFFEDGGNVVIDRFALGEVIYGPILRGEDRLGQDGWKIMRWLYSAAEVIEILCLPPIEVCLQNWHSRSGELFSDETTFRRVYHAYETIDEPTQYDYDFTNEEHEILLNYIGGRCY